MQEHHIFLPTPADTHQMGFWLGQHCIIPLFIGLNGNLGAGKTALSQGFGQGFGVTERLTSPTYNLLNVYSSPRGSLFHLDIYRLHDVEEVFELGIEEALEQPSVILMEWKNKFTDWPLNMSPLEIELEHHPRGRQLTLRAAQLQSLFNAPIPDDATGLA